jgi:hypothetical protein
VVVDAASGEATTNRKDDTDASQVNHSGESGLRCSSPSCGQITT